MSAVLLIRADASSEIGLGHVMRCLALGSAWQARGGRAVLAVTELPSAVREHLEAAGLVVRAIDAVPGGDDDLRLTLNAAGELGASWIVLDGYRFPSNWHRRVRDAGRHVLVLDDHAHLDRYEADLVLNQNAAANQTSYLNRAAHTRLLLGCSFALLRREFWADADERVIAPVARRVLVTLGGADLNDIGRIVTRSLVPMVDDGLEVDLVIGSAVPADAPFRTHAAGLGDGFTIHADGPSMRSLMERADLAITGGGSTGLELARLGVPGLAVVLAENQASLARALAEAGCSELLGTAGIDDIGARLAERLPALVADSDRRERMSRAGRDLVDGRGATRVVEHLWVREGATHA